MRKKGIAEPFNRAVMSLYEFIKKKAEVKTDMSEEFVVDIGVHQMFQLYLHS